ncbi:MAG: hypothetical protein HYV09_22180 [Deltaproteobacteria bacterium]|nr:hypothetical protein [Deltaproteobacteria bacterium]
MSCIDTAHHPAHCGACDHACSAAEVCDEGTCRSSCPKDRTVCRGSCRDVRWDPAHCGGCDHACEPGHVCTEGVCSFSCAGGTTRCGDACVDVRHDPANCGACAVACAKGATCVEGACACPTTTPDVCDATCVDKKTSPLHCGACGNACVNARCATARLPDSSGGSAPPIVATGCVRALAVAIGPSHGCARVQIGTIDDVWCWGDNAKHQLGREFVASDPVAAPVQRADGPWSIGFTPLLAVGPTSSYTEWRAWGSGLVMSSLTEAPRATPWSGPGWSGGAAQVMAIGRDHACAAASDGVVGCRGNNSYGQLGQGAAGTYYPLVWRADGYPLKAKKLSVMGDRTCAVEDFSDVGGVYCWGRDFWSPDVSRPVPLRITSHRATDVAVGADHGCLRSSVSGRWTCWGKNDRGQCGLDPALHGVSADGTLDTTWSSPRLVAGAGFNCGLDGGKVFCWGDNGDGQLGDGTTDAYSAKPREVFGITGAVDVSATDGAACALKGDGTIWCWGRQKTGRLGPAAEGVHRKPVRIEFAAGGSK